MTIRTLALAVLCAIAFPAAAHAAVPSPRDGEMKNMCRQINSFRAANGVAPMTLNYSLGNAAMWMSSDMANKNYFSHTDSYGRTYSVRTTAFGFPTGWVAENIAAGAADAFTIMNLWKNSPGHRANLLNPGYTVMGIGRGYNVNSTYDTYWTLDLGAGVAPGVIC